MPGATSSIVVEQRIEVEERHAAASGAGDHSIPLAAAPRAAGAVTRRAAGVSWSRRPLERP